MRVSFPRLVIMQRRFFFHTHIRMKTFATCDPHIKKTEEGSAVLRRLLTPSMVNAGPLFPKRGAWAFFFLFRRRHLVSKGGHYQTWLPIWGRPTRETRKRVLRAQFSRLKCVPWPFVA